MAVTKWSAYSSAVTAVRNDGTAPTAKNLANAARVLGNEIDNATNKDRWMDLELIARFGTNPTGGARMAVYLIPAIDGTNYADGDASIAPPSTSLIATFPLRAATTQQRVSAVRIPVPPGKFKLLLENSSGQTTTNTDGENGLTARFYNEETT